MTPQRSVLKPYLQQSAALACRQKACRRFVQCAVLQVEAAAAEKSTAERQGKTVESLPNDSLFFIDKVDHLPTDGHPI